jgi:hypothetical protein
MLKNLAEVKKEKAQVFQVLLLNDASEEVRVQESEHIAFLRVQRHLKKGGSAFITSKNSQKLPLPKEKIAHRNKNTARTITAFNFSQI